MAEFNLIEEPWIPCIDLDGRMVQLENKPPGLGIRDTLLRARELREICDDSPLVTVAIHRLLLAILYRAFQGPSDFQQWKALYVQASFKGNDGIVNYLNQWHDRFFLFDDKHPLFQMAQLEMKLSISITRLATECASGNNATLFDHCFDDQEIDCLPSQAARQLIACQSFALGFGKSGNARINGKEETLPYSADAIALRGMTVWLQGKTLFDTLMFNLAPQDDSSIPPWELSDSHMYRDRLMGKNKKAVSSFGVVDRFTWQSRLIRLIPNGKKVSRIYFTQGRSADKSMGDPMKIYKMSKEEGVSAIPLSTDKAAWRDAHSIFRISQPSSNERRPDCFNLLAQAQFAGIVSPNQLFVTQIVGLATPPKKAGKFLLWRHERMPVSAALLANNSMIEQLGKLLQNAEQAADQLYSRTRRISELYLSPCRDESDGRKPDDKDVAKLIEKIDPRPVYWARLEKHFLNLLENLPNDWDAVNDDWKSDDQQTATRNWREHVKYEAKHALEESIQSLGTTARAVAAIARVRTDFNDNDLKSLPQNAVKSKRNPKGGKKK